MKIFITDISGMLGQDIMKEALSQGHEVTGCSRDNENYIQLDLTNVLEIKNIIQEIHPDIIIHCDEYRSIEQAERHPENVEEINHYETQYFAEAAQDIDATMVYISTNQVFDGTQTTPLKTTDLTNPLNVYGRTKLQGEEAVKSILKKYFIIRTSWLFGKNGDNFIKTMINIGCNLSSINMICDEKATPTYTVDLAKLIIQMINSNKYGIYHATNENGNISEFDFCNEIFKQMNINIEVFPYTAQDCPTNPAPKPKNGYLYNRKLIGNGFTLLPDYKDAIHRYLIEDNFI